MTTPQALPKIKSTRLATSFYPGNNGFCAAPAIVDDRRDMQF
jgi:hypothetical protein